MNAQKKLFEVEEVLSENGGPLPLSRSGIYLSLKNGSIPSVKIGKRVFIPSWYIDQILNEPTYTSKAIG